MINGYCDCKNIEVKWAIDDCKLIPRACQCEYCVSKSAAYVSRPGTAVEIFIRNPDLHKEVKHGSNSAIFHECENCNQIIFVTAEMDGECYGALNARQLTNKMDFLAEVKSNIAQQSAIQKKERWRRNWCCPVVIKFGRD